MSAEEQIKARQNIVAQEASTIAGNAGTLNFAIIPIDKCANDGCDSGLLFHYCCQITFLEKHDKETTTKRCYECAQEIVLGLS